MASPIRDAWVLASGTELTLGQTVDTNSAWLSVQLAGLGVRVIRHITVPDDIDELVSCLRDGLLAVDLVLLSGGLGLTEDDLARAALATATDDHLVEDPESLAAIRAFFAARRREMPPQNAVQAQRPSRSSALDNPRGTAPGIFIEHQGVWLAALPGVPAEMKSMFDQHIAPRIRARGGGRTLRSRVLYTIGMGESDVGALIRDRMTRGRNPEVGTTAKLGIVGVRINAQAETPADAERMLDEETALLEQRLGDALFGRDEQTLASVVGGLLQERGASLALAESCTGGLLSKHMTDVPGSSAYFLGGLVIYTNEAKQKLLGVPAETLDTHGAVSEATALALAQSARERLAADYALSITGVAGPGGGTQSSPVGTVWIGLDSKSGVVARLHHFGADATRESIRERAVVAALHMLLRELRRA